MGALYDLVQRIEASIERQGLPRFKVKGSIGLKAGLLLSLVTPDTPDDPAKVEAVKAAARDVLGDSF